MKQKWPILANIQTTSKLGMGNTIFFFLPITKINRSFFNFFNKPATATKEEGEKMVVLPSFVATNIHKIENYFTQAKTNM